MRLARRSLSLSRLSNGMCTLVQHTRMFWCMRSHPEFFSVLGPGRPITGELFLKTLLLDLSRSVSGLQIFSNHRPSSLTGGQPVYAFGLWKESTDKSSELACKGSWQNESFTSFLFVIELLLETDSSDKGER